MAQRGFSVNRRFYASDVVVAHYARQTALRPPEARVLSRYAKTIARGSLLDVGVGGGRTLPELTAMSRCYTAIDYAAPMIEHCRSKFPGASLFCCDVRKMTIFADRTFDVVCALVNGLADLPDKGRRRALAEIHRVLRPKGLFIFSAHNLRTVEEGDRARFAVVMEEMYGTQLPTSYISREEQTAQLRAAGFDVIEVADWQGYVLPEDVAPPDDPWLYYVARKR